MYRFAIGIIIGVVTFAFSVLITLNFYYHSVETEPLPNVIEGQSSTKNELKAVGYGNGIGYRFGGGFQNKEQNPKSVEKRKPVVCNDKTISVIWKQLINNHKDFWDWTNSTLEVYDCAQMFEAEKIDLNNDGIKEIKIRGKFGNFCGATGNCSEWIFGKMNKSAKYKLLLESGGEYFYVRKNSTNDYRDIYITTHDSASSSYHYVYKFSEKRYQESKCWFEDHLIDGEKYSMSCTEKTKQSKEELRESEAKLKENSND